MIFIKNLKLRPKEMNAWDIQICRPSPLGNPFTVGKYGRNEAIERYRLWLWSRMQDTTPQMQMLCFILQAEKRFGTVNLWCWCHPERCHGEIIVNAIRWMEGRK